MWIRFLFVRRDGPVLVSGESNGDRCWLIIYLLNHNFVHKMSMNEPIQRFNDGVK